MRNIFITGGSGFIGEHLSKLLQKENIPFSRDRIDLLDKQSIRDYFKTHQFDTVVHLAGRFGNDFNVLLEANVKTTWNLCNTLSQTGVTKIIFVSSGAVYGPPINSFESYETDVPYPDTVYGLTKYFGEQVIDSCAKNKGIVSIILRLPNVYGPGGQGILNRMMSDIRKHGTVTVAGDGSKSRDYIHVVDVCCSILEIVSANVSQSDIYNLSSNARYTVQEIAQSLSRKFHCAIEHNPEDASGRVLHLNSRKFREHFHYIMRHELIDFDALYRNIL